MTVRSREKYPYDKTDSMKTTPAQLMTGFRLRVSRVSDDREQRLKTKVLLETVQSFASFVYDLAVEENRKGNSIRLRILGLKPPQLSLSATGPARFERTYEDLTGACELTVENIDGSANTFRFRVVRNTVKLLQPPLRPFIEFIS